MLFQIITNIALLVYSSIPHYVIHQKKLESDLPVELDRSRRHVYTILILTFSNVSIYFFSRYFFWPDVNPIDYLMVMTQMDMLANVMIFYIGWGSTTMRYEREVMMLGL